MMNETNIKYGYNLMVLDNDARGAILNPGARISKSWAEFIQPGVQYWSQGCNTGATHGHGVQWKVSLGDGWMLLYEEYFDYQKVK